ncbi:MAG: hypothetical protein QGF79_03130 [Arenicellales bacterium]|nr:hypothetical protein [Arenicellales bacterium]
MPAQSASASLMSEKMGVTVVSTVTQYRPAIASYVVNDGCHLPSAIEYAFGPLARLPVW